MSNASPDRRRWHRRDLSIAVTVLLAPAVTGGAYAAPVLTQSVDTVVTPPGGQVQTPDGPAFETSVDQLTARRGGPAPAEQVGSGRETGGRAIDQLAPRARPSTATGQLTTGRRSADATAPLSRPAEGRAQQVVRLQGSDLCEGASGSRPEVCARVIETRSGEFARAPATPLSAEQRLLIDQRLREQPSSPQGAANRVARNDIDPDAADVQSIASISLPAMQPADAPLPTPDPMMPVVDSLGAALIEAIVERAQSGVPR